MLQITYMYVNYYIPATVHGVLLGAGRFSGMLLYMQVWMTWFSCIRSASFSACSDKLPFCFVRATRLSWTNNIHNLIQENSLQTVYE